MANTTNLDLVKPAGTDHALISVLNSNSDKIDAFAGQTNDSLSAEQNGLAYIVGNTNTTGGTLAVGQFVYVKGHSTIAEGLRKVTASISANGSITTSNTDACSEGGLNALNSKITPLFNQKVWNDWSVISLQNCQAWNENRYIKIGNIVYVMLSVKSLTENSNTQIAADNTLPTGYRPIQKVEFAGFGGAAYLNMAHFTINTSGSITVCSADNYAAGFISFPVSTN